MWVPMQRKDVAPRIDQDRIYNILCILFSMSAYLRSRASAGRAQTAIGKEIRITYGHNDGHPEALPYIRRDADRIGANGRERRS